MRARSPIALAALLLSGGALADGISGLIEEQYTLSHGQVGDQTGAFVRNDVEQFVQRYRLSLDRTVFPLMRVAAGGVFEKFSGTSDFGDLSTSLDSRTTNFFANISAGNSILAAAAGYTWRDQTSGTNLIPYGFMSDQWDVNLTWRPTGLPEFAFRYSRPSLWDSDHRIQDLTTNQFLMTVGYVPTRQLDLRYALEVTSPEDRLHHTETTTVTQALRANWTDRLLDGRVSASASGNVSNQQFTVRHAGPGGSITTRQTPIAGFSLVEQFPATPDFDVLLQNGALVNGDTNASAGINLGVSRTLAGDVVNRDVGAQFADEVTAVNSIWVWLDRQLPPAVAQALTWTIWESRDNQTWKQVPLDGAVFANPFSPHYEIPIRVTRARFIKVVTKPLTPAATPDPAFNDVFVTEIQFFFAAPVTAGPGWASSTTAALSLSARTQLIRDPMLAHDISLFLTGGTRTGGGSGAAYALINGLTFTRRLTTILLLNARVARQDSDQSRGHEGEWSYGASLGVTPLRTFTGSLIYSGRYNTSGAGSTTTNTLAALAELEPYRGIALLGYASYGLSGLVTGQTTAIDTLTISTTIQPHPDVTLSGTFGHSASLTTGAGLRSSSNVTNRVDANATVSPFRSLYVTGGVARIVTQGAAPVTLANGTVSFSPFRGGDLQVGVVYTQTLESDASVTRLLSPNLRWNIRRATLSASYNVLRTDSRAEPSRSNTFTADLKIPL